MLSSVYQPQQPNQNITEMDSPTTDSGAKKHVRQASSGRALPRRPTRGPLDISDPLSPTNYVNVSHPLTGSAQRPRTPRLPSPGPGSNLSASTYMTAPTSLSPSQNASFKSTVSTLQKDFSHLLRPEIYHPLPVLDIPPPFRSSPASTLPPNPDINTLSSLLASGYFRASAILAASLLTSTPGPTSHTEIFDLFYIRLACLTLCNQTQLAAHEVKALEDLNAAYFRDDETGEHMVGWELRVLAVRLQGLGLGDVRRGVIGYYDLARDARDTLTKLKKRKSMGDEEDVDAEIALWESRLADLGIRVASALVEMEDLVGAGLHLKSLEVGGAGEEDLRAKKALLWLCLGDVESARQCLKRNGEAGSSEMDKTIQALSLVAEGNYEEAVGVWEELIANEESTAGKGEKAMWRQNLGVSLLYLGRGEEAKHILEGLISENNSFHALTFNLSTIYELCTERSRGLKSALAEKVAGMVDGAANEGVVRAWEKVNGDFKL
ncbi:tetratricopeptide-like helical protein [Rutstroemia sp. NJR-2017a BVV2]|nr:tetratricopeptide-like helical protein [Rutstroemia sp. NJR-2017a BVV2]